MSGWWTLAGIIVGILASLGAFIRWAMPMLRKIGHVVDDWIGEEPRPGYPGRPGAMERLSRIEHEVHPNKGSSMRDAVSRSENGINDLSERVAILTERLTQHLEASERASVLAKAEGIEMWRAIHGLTLASPPAEPVPATPTVTAPTNTEDQS